MNKIKFIWDKQKAITNKRKHKISFEEAITVFYDEKGRIIYDPDHSFEEERYILLGMSSKLKLLIVCHCYKEENNNIRIFSARKATKNEQKQYWEVY
jgi:hypothetical protein